MERQAWNRGAVYEISIIRWHYRTEARGTSARPAAPELPTRCGYSRTRQLWTTGLFMPRRTIMIEVPGRLA